MKHILIVDDSTVIRKIAKRILESLHFETSEADDGEKALAMCMERMPDGILLDWNMPVMDGLTFLQNLRSRPDGTHPKVIFCTTENDVSHIARALHAAPGHLKSAPRAG